MQILSTLKHIQTFEDFLNESEEKLITHDILMKVFPKLKFEFNSEEAEVNGDNIFVPFSSSGKNNSAYLAKVRSTFEESLKKALKAEGYSPKQYEVKINLSNKHPYLSGWNMKIILK